jgi:membrane protein implicated in regulation of membrane protease activity
MFSFEAKSIVLFEQALPGVVEKTIEPGDKGQIKFQGSYWSATLYPPNQGKSIPKGQRVNVIGREGITLLVQPIH